MEGIKFASMLEKKRISSRIALYLFFVVIAIAIALRFYNLDLRPFHHDESVHAHFSYQLFKLGIDKYASLYPYNPMWHGPFQYYLTAVLYRLFGDGEWISRMMPALFGVCLVALPFTLKKYLGFKASFITAFLLAISPSFLYYSRFFRNDISLAFFSLAAVVCVIHFLEKKKPVFIYLASFLFALSLCTKESAYITSFIFFSFVVLYLIYTRGQRTLKDVMMILKANWLPTIVSLSIIAIIYTSFHSFFFRNPQDSFALFRAVSHWASYHTGPTGPPFFYAALALLYELPILIFGIVGIFYFACKKDLLMVFMSYWAISSFFIYSFVVYEKAPWLLLHLLLPLAFIAGKFTVNLSFEKKALPKKLIFTAFTLVVLSFCIFTSVNLNYYHFDDPAEPMIQAAQPPRSFNDLMAKIKEVAVENEGNQTRIQVVDGIATTQYLWYLRHYNRVEWQPRLLFTMDIEKKIEEDLNNGIIPERLRDKFKDLSKNYVILKEREGKWIIGDIENKNIYIVKKEGMELKIYCYPSKLNAPIILVSADNMPIIWIGDKIEVVKNLSGYHQLNSSVMQWHWYPLTVTDFLSYASPDYLVFRKIDSEPAKTEVILFYRVKNHEISRETFSYVGLRPTTPQAL